MRLGPLAVMLRPLPRRTAPGRAIMDVTIFLHSIINVLAALAQGQLGLPPINA